MADAADAAVGAAACACDAGSPCADASDITPSAAPILSTARDRFRYASEGTAMQNRQHSFITVARAAP